MSNEVHRRHNADFNASRISAVFTSKVSATLDLSRRAHCRAVAQLGSSPAASELP
jgi:hypothetical protein